MPLKPFPDSHYVPIMKSKQGERWALSGTNTARRNVVTPLVEFHGSDALSANDQVSAMCEALAVEWGTDDHLFLDLKWLQPESGNPELISGLAEAARNSSLLGIPVATVNLDETCRDQLAAEIETDSNGCLLRLRPADLQNQNQIIELVSDLAIEANDVHLLIDYQSAAPNIAFDLGRVPMLANWRTVTVASGSFPRSLGAYPLDDWFTLPRTEWTAWLQARSVGTLKRTPSFGDYTTRDPGAPAKGGKPSVNVRYTRSSDWLCRMGGRLEDGAAPQMKEFCSLLIAHPSYSGAGYSAGDAEYWNKSLPDTGTGGAGDWAKWPISHHIAFVADQMALIADV